MLLVFAVESGHWCCDRVVSLFCISRLVEGDLMAELIIKEHKSSSYAPRTYHNASVADFTMALAVDHNTAGEKCTQKAALGKILKLHHQAADDIVLARQLYHALKNANARIINVAGNGIYTWKEHGCTQEYVNECVYYIYYLLYINTTESIRLSVEGKQEQT